MKFKTSYSRSPKPGSNPSPKAKPSDKKFLQGQVKRHPDGFGFFIPDAPDHPDVYIPRHFMGRVMSNDKVLIEVIPEPGGERYRGEVIRITARATATAVGTFHTSKAGGYIRDEAKAWGQDIKVPSENCLNAKEGDLVEVDLVKYPEADGDPLVGKIKQVIGQTSDPLTDIRRVLVSQHIPNEFSKATLEEAAGFPKEVTPDQWQNKKDLRNLNFITIDGATAKDFDDAIYVEAEGSGFKLWVAIADVSHYVKEGTAMDRDAYERGTSVYFPNYVVPMLPEALSNGLCSLMPHVPRLSLVCEMRMDGMGVVKSSTFFEAVIESKARVTYGEAQDVVDGQKSEKLQHVSKEILQAAALAKILMAKRFEEGSLDLEIPEVQIVLNSAGETIDMIKSERLFAHRLIEELMLAANIEAAKLFHERKAPGLYRVHEPPKEEMIDLLKNYLEQFGAKADFKAGLLQKRLTRALQEFAGRPESQVLNILALRSMNQAKYSSNNLGHFGLGFEFYTHFTSPIRRYPDLIVHRIIKNLIRAPGKYRSYGEEELTTSGTMLSASEQRSVKAERMFVSIKKARFMMNHIGEEFDGVISSVARFGVFVLLRTFEVDGLVRVENLAKEKLDFDEEHLWLVAPRSGLRYSIGDAVRIRVASADPVAGQIDFELAGTPAAAKADKSKNEGRNPQARGSNEKHVIEKHVNEQHASGGRRSGRRGRGRQGEGDRNRDARENGRSVDGAEIRINREARGEDNRGPGGKGARSKRGRRGQDHRTDPSVSENTDSRGSTQGGGNAGGQVRSGGRNPNVGRDADSREGRNENTEYQRNQSEARDDRPSRNQNARGSNRSGNAGSESRTGRRGSTERGGDAGSQGRTGRRGSSNRGGNTGNQARTGRRDNRGGGVVEPSEVRNENVRGRDKRSGGSTEVRASKGSESRTGRGATRAAGRGDVIGNGKRSASEQRPAKPAPAVTTKKAADIFKTRDRTKVVSAPEKPKSFAASLRDRFRRKDKKK